MPVIEIEIRNKIARQANDVPYVCNNDDYSLAFDFDAEWDAYPLKTARFSYNGKYFEVVFSGNTCQVPVMEDTSSIDVGVYAGDLRATTPVAVLAKKSILCGDDIQHEAPPEDVYNQIMAELNEEGRWIENTKAEAVTAANEANEAKIEANNSAQAAKDAASAAEADKKLASQHASSASDSQKLASEAANLATSAKIDAHNAANEAASQARKASSSAAAAADSAASAANKASAAASSAENADASARAAAQREVAAAEAAAAAAAYAGTAAQAATVAESKASEADSSAARAATSESNAASKAAEAADAANASAQSQSAAGVSAAEAEAFAEAAAQSEAAAAQSAGNAAAAATNAANAVLEEAKESGEFDGPVGKDGTSFFYSTASPGTVIGSLYGFDLSTIETNGRTISAGDFILSAVGYIYRVEANLGTYVNAVCIQRGVGVDGSSLFYSTMDADHYVGGRRAIALDTISTMGRKISEGDLILAANDFLYRVVGVRATEVDGECLQRWSGIDGLCIYQTYSTPTKTSSGSRYYTISGGAIETSGRQFSVGDLILAGDGEMYRIDALLDQPPNHLYLEWLTRWRGRDGGIQTVNGIEPDENGNVEIVAGTQPDWNQNDPTALDYVKNRTHWEEVKLGEILLDKSLDFDNGVGFDRVSIKLDAELLAIGKTYAVNWNGTEYVCEAVAKEDILPDGVGFTSSAFDIVGAFSTDPTEIGYYTMLFAPLDGSLSADVTIRERIEEIHKLPGKFLPDGVPYVEEGGMVELPVVGEWADDGLDTDEDGVIDAHSYLFTVTAPIGLEVGETYTVNWDGVDYPCVAQSFDMEGIAAIALGNVGAMTGGTPTEEPFVLMELSKEGAAAMGAYAVIMQLDGQYNGEFAIYGGSVTVHKIDPRCLPTGVPYVEESDDFSATLLPETEATLHDATEGVWRIEAVPPLKIGETYIINYNGTEYTCIAQDSSSLSGGTGSVALGNLSNVGGFGNGEPFIFFTRPSSGVSDILNYRSSTPVTIAIYGKSVKVQKMDERCLPDNIGGVYTAVFDLVIGDNSFTATARRSFEEVHAKAIDLNTLVRGVAYMYYPNDLTTPVGMSMLNLVEVNDLDNTIVFNSFAVDSDVNIRMIDLSFRSDGEVSADMGVNVSN